MVSEYAFGTSRTYGYRYDLAGRLYGVTLDGDTIAVYGYDADGNRTSFVNPTTGDTASATYDQQDRMLRYRNTAYAYTAAGDLATKTLGSSVTRYTYDALGSLLKVVLPSGDSITYSVDGTSRRVGRRSNGAWTGGWAYDGPVSIVGELDSTGTVLNRYIYGADGQTPALMVRGGTTYRLIVDQLGSVRALLDASSGTVLQQTDYDAWGVPTVLSGAGVQSLGYAGGLADASTGLVRFGARDYEPLAGRWTAQDPSGFLGGIESLYAYSRNMPHMLTDPGGRSVYGPTRRMTPEDIYANTLRTACKVRPTLTLGQFWAYYLDLVAPGRPLDIKAAGWLRGMGLSDDEIDAVGNKNFGILSAALGIPEWLALAGAGGADVLQVAVLAFQNRPAFRDEIAKQRSVWLDDADDAKAIGEGYDYYRTHIQRGR